MLHPALDGDVIDLHTAFGSSSSTSRQDRP
jgi:hypothetical protein